LIEYAIKEAKNNKFVKDEDKVIIIQGAEEMNPDDCEILKIVNVWKNWFLKYYYLFL